MEGINIQAFKEPRGVMRILHFIFSICAFATITGYSGYIQFNCKIMQKTSFSYPFVVREESIYLDNNNCTATVNFDFSSDAKFFVATGVLAMLFAIASVVLYLKFDGMYKSNNQLPLADFIITVIFGVLWLSSSAAWANSLSGLKSMTDLQTKCQCTSITTSNFSGLNISVLFGFLNFFLWAADLWFIYKETAWFPGNQQQEATSGV